MSLVKHTKIEILKMNAAIDNEIINQVVVDSMNFDLLDISMSFKLGKIHEWIFSEYEKMNEYLGHSTITQ